MKTICLILIYTLLCLQIHAQAKNEYGTFSFSFDVAVEGQPEDLFDKATGDVSGWWDHTMSENPIKLYIEPKAGGGFWEIFDSEGNGVRHAEIIYAHRGELLRIEGPLGLSGMAIQLVSSIAFDSLGVDSTKITVTVNAAGQLQKDQDKIVEKVWRHFMIERFKPYAEGQLEE